MDLNLIYLKKLKALSKRDSEWFLRHGWGHRDKHEFCLCMLFLYQREWRKGNGDVMGVADETL